MPIECRDPDRERRKVVGRGEQKSGAFELEADHERFPVSFGKVSRMCDIRQSLNPMRDKIPHAQSRAIVARATHRPRLR